MHHPDRRAGFTLIEVLAALVVTTAIVAVVLPYAARLATHWWIGETAVEQGDAWMQAIDRMSDDVAQAVPFGLDKDGQRVLAFSATADSMTFLRPALARPGDLETVSYIVLPSDTGSALVRRSHRFDPSRFGSEGPGTGAPATLISGPYRFRLVSIAGDGSRQRAWTPSQQMPVAVEFSASAMGRDPVPAAPFILRIPAQASATPATPGSSGPAAAPKPPDPSISVSSSP